jgi:hypothetical protein
LFNHQLNQRPDTTLLRPEKSDDFMAGEMRVNEHPFLTTLHIVFVKEHNRIAKLLKEYLPTALQTVRSHFKHGWLSTKIDESIYFIPNKEMCYLFDESA